MAPFKLKFRMGGGSRSTSSEQEADASAQGSQSVINSTTSLIHFGSTSTIDSDHNTDSLVSLGNNDQRALLQNCGQTSTDTVGFTNPSLAHTELNKTPATKQIPSTPPPSYEHVLEENRLAALDKENNQTFLLHTIMHNNQTMNASQQQLNEQCRHESSTSSERDDGTDERLLCTGSCDTLCSQQRQQQVLNDEQSGVSSSENMCNLGDTESINLSDIDCHSYENSYQENLYENYQIPSEQQQQPHQQQKPGKEIIYKSSKEMYKAVAKECGITCKMSDQCRCLDCQSRYFDCEYEQNENEKTDGGLGAGTPLYLSEVMHGTACTIL